MSDKFHKFYGFEAPSAKMNNPPYLTYHATLSAGEQSTTPASMFNQGYVEWYWVALGLVVPIFLGTLFCILDHLRRRQSKSSNSSEQRIESMCERNKYVPPSYEDVIPNNIVIDSLPDLRVMSNDRATLLPRPGVTNQSPQITAVPSPELQSQLSTETDTTSISTVEDQVDNTNSLYTSSTVLLAYATIEHETTYSTDSIDDSSAIPEEPPSYEDHAKYEVFGSQMQLV